MEHSTLFANRGAPVSMAAIDEDRLDDMSLGELAYARALLGQKFAERLADPSAMADVATFSKAPGADWSGFTSEGQQVSAEDNDERNDNSDDVSDSQGADEGYIPPPEPVAPDNYVDTIPAIMALMSSTDRTNDAALANMTAKLTVAVGDQATYLGVPHGTRGFGNVKELLRQSMKISGKKAKTFQTRATYIAYSVGTDRTSAGAAPKLSTLAAACIAGKVPAENLDRIISTDQDLTKYATAVGQTIDYKDAVLEVFEPTLVEAAESVTPEELSQAKQRWIERIAHHIDNDGPSPSETLKKRPDNALHVRSHDDGSATASVHMDPIWAAFVKEFLNTNLNYKGNAPLLPENIENLYAAMAEAKAEQDETQSASDDQKSGTDSDQHEHSATSDVEEDSATSTDQEPTASGTSAVGSYASFFVGPDEQPPDEPPRTEQQRREDLHEILGTTPDPGMLPTNQVEAQLPQPVDSDTVIAEDHDGKAYTRREVDWIDSLTRAERAGAVVLGALYAVMSMHPDEAAAKRAHGTAAKLVIVQDIQTAHKTLGLPSLPEAVRRPDGPDGLLPTAVKRPNPDHDTRPGRLEGMGNQNDSADCDEGFHGYANPVSWTQYQSEGVNIGPIHPNHTGPTLCDAELVGQIWNGPDIVLNEYRDKRLFTTAQRKAIFARDKGCQAPGCTVQATYCHCHHCKEWSKDGHTNEANAITLCSRHHTDVHNRKWTIRKHDGVTYFQPAKWLDPYQPLLRNLYWNI